MEVLKNNAVYYAIYIRNYVVFYTVMDDVMEVRRFVYNRQNTRNRL